MFWPICNTAIISTIWAKKLFAYRRVANHLTCRGLCAWSSALPNRTLRNARLPLLLSLRLMHVPTAQTKTCSMFLRWEVLSSAKSSFLGSNHSRQHSLHWNGLCSVPKYTTSMVIHTGLMTLTLHHPKSKRWRSIIRVKLIMNNPSATITSRGVRWITSLFPQLWLLWVEIQSVPTCLNLKLYFRHSTSAKRVKIRKVTAQTTLLSRPIRSNSVMSITFTIMYRVMMKRVIINESDVHAHPPLAHPRKRRRSGLVS